MPRSSQILPLKRRTNDDGIRTSETDVECHLSDKERNRLMSLLFARSSSFVRSRSRSRFLNDSSRPAEKNMTLRCFRVI